MFDILSNQNTTSYFVICFFRNEYKIMWPNSINLFGYKSWLLEQSHMDSFFLHESQKVVRRFFKMVRWIGNTFRPFGFIVFFLQAKLAEAESVHIYWGSVRVTEMEEILNLFWFGDHFIHLCLSHILVRSSSPQHTVSCSDFYEFKLWDRTS